MELVKLVLKSAPALENILNNLLKIGCKIYLVGGVVRDFFLGLDIKDIDIEIHNISYEALVVEISKFCEVNIVGKSFGVIKLVGLNVDISLPRSDSIGRKPEVKIDQNMDIINALKRRDLTMNSMAIDFATGRLYDPYNGFSDLKSSILRATDISKFTEDPLRFFRVMQFVSRFNMQPDFELNDLCKKIDISNVSIERIGIEFEKMILKSQKPSLGLIWIFNISRMRDIFPELYACASVPQDPVWHPEGTVFNHLMLSLDASKKIIDKDQLVIAYASLCHDLGKAVTTRFFNSHWRSFGHAEAGVGLAENFLKRLTKNKNLILKVKKLVRYHMELSYLIKINSDDSGFKVLANNLYPEVNLDLLSKLYFCDLSGKLAKTDNFEIFRTKCKKLKLMYSKEKPLLTGFDIIEYFNNQNIEGFKIGLLLKYAYDLQIKKNIKSKKILKSLILNDKKV